MLRIVWNFVTLIRRSISKDKKHEISKFYQLCHFLALQLLIRLNNWLYYHHMDYNRNSTMSRVRQSWKHIHFSVRSGSVWSGSQNNLSPIRSIIHKIWSSASNTRKNILYITCGNCAKKNECIRKLHFCILMYYWITSIEH